MHVSGCLCESTISITIIHHYFLLNCQSDTAGSFFFSGLGLQKCMQHSSYKGSLNLWRGFFFFFFVFFNKTSSKFTATWCPLRTEESENLGTQKAYEWFWEHLSGFLGSVVEEVLWMSQHIEQGLHEFLVLGRNKSVWRQIEWRVLPKDSWRGRYTARGLSLMRWAYVGDVHGFSTA